MITLPIVHDDDVLVAATSKLVSYEHFRRLSFERLAGLAREAHRVALICTAIFRRALLYHLDDVVAGTDVTNCLVDRAQPG